MRRKRLGHLWQGPPWECSRRQLNSCFFYGYEYLAAIGVSGTSYKYGNDLEANFVSNDFGKNIKSADERVTST